MRKAILTALAIALVGAGGSAQAQTVVSTDVIANTTWSGTIVLNGVIFVRNGAVLTILPGTIVRGQPRTAAPVEGQTTGTPGALIVTQDGRIVANASRSNPIIFTTAATDNDGNNRADDIAENGGAGNGFLDTWEPGDTFYDDAPASQPLAPLDPVGKANVSLWGGVVVLGNAPTNNALKAGASVGYGKTLIEGLTFPGFPAAQATYGGILPHDNSGILRFVSIRHAGDELGNGNELNGLSLGGVGDGTVVENVEVYANFDDGIEWFGGTVGGKNLHVAFVGDDMYDVDEGYTGVNQFLFGVMPFFNAAGGNFGSSSGDKATEFDGDNYRPDNTAFNDNVNIRLSVDQVDVDTTPSPLSSSNWYNLTAIGSTPDSGAEFDGTDLTGAGLSAASANLGIQMRNGFAGNVFNSVVLNTGSSKGFAIDTDLGDGAPGFDAITNVNNGLIALVCTTLDDTGALAAAENTAVANGNALNELLGGNATSGDNTVNVAGFPGLVNEDTTFDPRGNASGKLVAGLKGSVINPRPNSGLTGTGGCAAPRGTGLDAAATYRGAFLRTASQLWTTDWTVLSIAGLLAD